MKNYYHTLNLQNFASLDEIRRAYRKLALVHHPDRGGDVEKMKEINYAYEHLMKFKDEYDAALTPRRPVLRNHGFTIVVNGFGYGFEMATNNNTTGATWHF